MNLAGVINSINHEFGIQIDPREARSATGGSINDAWCLASDQGPVFLKTNKPDKLDMFAAEVDGLQGLSKAGCVTVPRVLGHGACADVAFLLLEFVDLSGAKSSAAARRLGRDLARQHRQSQAGFGWHRDNYIGSTPQPNSNHGNWCEFFCQQRLSHQLRLAADNGYRDLHRRGRELLGVVPNLLADHHPPPALLHGDLWGGNWGVSAAGLPLLFDPAVYMGDREADLAMTQLFGGFPTAFYEGYEAEWPLTDGWQERTELYNLYHVLNHVNLFGGGYLGQAQASIERLLDRGLQP